MAVDPTTIAKERQTSPGLYVTAKDAYDMWQADPEGVRILDVHSPEEYVFVGHAPMAWNIPLAFPSFEWDPQKKAAQESVWHLAVSPASSEYTGQRKW